MNNGRINVTVPAELPADFSVVSKRVASSEDRVSYGASVNFPIDLAADADGNCCLFIREFYLDFPRSRWIPDGSFILFFDALNYVVNLTATSRAIGG